MIIYEGLIIAFNLVRHGSLYKTSEGFGMYSVTCSPFYSAVNMLLNCGQGIFKVAD